MAATRVCDSCRTEIADDNPVVFKLYLTPVLPGKLSQHHGHYTASMEIGRCCADKFLKLHWTKRRTQEDYHRDRRLRTAANAVAKSNGAAKVTKARAAKR
jgi:hypothetical protein